MHGQIVWIMDALDREATMGLIERLAAYGLGLADPSTGQVRVWGATVETAGMFWPLSVDALIDSLGVRGGSAVSIQVWLASGASIIAAFTPHGDNLVLSLGLDGLVNVDAQALSATLLWAAVNEPTSRAVIVDLGLPETRAEWDRFLANTQIPIPPTAALVWVAAGSGSGMLLQANPYSWGLAT